MKKRQLDKQLAKYSVAAGAVVAGSAGAEAAVQYTAADLTIGTGNTGQSIDFDGDLTSDLMLTHSFSPGAGMGGSGATMISAWAQMLNNAQIEKSGGSAANIASGASISSGLSWAAGWGKLFSQYYGTMSTGNFLKSPGYLGIRFDPLGGTDWKYGWLHIDFVADDLLSYHVDGYAYEDSGAPIDAGEIPAPIPEPSSLVLLALGAAGIRFIRGHYGHI